MFRCSMISFRIGKRLHSYMICPKPCTILLQHVVYNWHHIEAQHEFAIQIQAARPA